MPTSEELILAIRSEGVDEVRDELDGASKSMEQLAEEAGDSAEEMEGFTNRMAGAMSAAVAALAVGTAGLLSQIPVLGEAFSGLAAIARALIFQVDQLARQLGAGGLISGAFDVADAIYSFEGAAGDLIGALTGLVSLAAIGYAAFLKFGGAFAAVGAKLSGVIAAIKTVGVAIATITGVSLSTVAAVGVLIAAIVALATALIFNIGGARDKTVAALNTIISALGDVAAGARSKLMGVIQAFINLAGNLVEWAGNLASDAYSWGVNLINRFIAGIKSAISGAQDFLGGVADSIGIDIPDVSGSVSVGSASVGGGGGGVANTAASAFADRGRSGGGGTTQIDGRQIAESTGRYRSDPARRQGL